MADNPYGSLAAAPPDPSNLDQMAAFYQRPDVARFIQAATTEANRTGGGASASVGAGLWAVQHAKEFGLTDADLQAMFAVQQRGYAYDPSAKQMKPIDSRLAKVGKFVLGYVMPAVIGATAVGPALGGIGGGGGGAATSSASSWLTSPAVATGIQAGAGLAGAYMTTRAYTKAAELQKQSTDAALAYEKEQDAYKRATEAERYGYSRATEANRYGAMSGALRPYVGGGGAAESRMAELLGLPPSSSSMPPQGPSGPSQGPPGGPPRYGIGAPAPPQHGPASGPPGASEMVLMRAPDGTTKQVPASEIDHWTRLGATVVGGQA